MNEQQNENKKNSSTLLRDLLIILLSSIISICAIFTLGKLGYITFGKNNNDDLSSSNDLIAAAAKARACSVSVFCNYYSGSTKASAGSGVIMKYNADTDTAYVITNHHVIDSVDSDEIKILPSDSSYLINATLIGTDPENDIAVISYQTAIAPSTAELGRHLQSLKVGEPTIAVGNPHGYYDSTSSGIISAIGRYVDMNGVEKRYIQTTAEINGGNSGGGLFDKDGKLIGINTLGVNGADGLSFSLPIKFNLNTSPSSLDYNSEYRDALSSFNCLIKSHEDLLADSTQINKIGYINGQKTIGAAFETYSIVENVGGEQKYLPNVYIEDIYEFASIESSTPSSWIEPTNISNTVQRVDFVQKVSKSTDAGLSYEVIEYVENLSLKTLEHDASQNKSFSAVNLMTEISKLEIDTFIELKIKTYTIDGEAGTITSDGSTKTIIVKVQQYRYQTPDQIQK